MIIEDFKLRSLLIFLSIYFLIFITGYFSTIPFYFAVLAAIVLSLCGGVYSIFALSFYTILKYLNPAIYHFPSEFSAGAWLVLGLCAARNIFSARSSSWKILTPLIIFSIVIAILSALSSSHLDISIMKLVAFVVGVSTVIASFSQCSKKDLSLLQHWIIAIYISVIVFSIVSLTHREQAYFVNGVGFQGILNHPQSFGIFLSPLLTGCVALISFGRVKLISIYTIVAALLTLLIFMSQTRTALVTVALSLTCVFIIYLINIRKYRDWGTLKKVFINVSLFLFVLISSFLFSTAVRDTAAGFIFKRGSTNIDQAVSSRADGYEAQFRNFLQKPILGHGFGVYPNGQLGAKEIRTFMGIPISAPVEKGLILTALLEETGIIGTLLFFVLIVSIARRALLYKNIAWVSIFFSCLFVNVGEAVFFSVGGIGLFYWILLTLCSYGYKLNPPAQPQFQTATVKDAALSKSSINR